MKMCSKKFGNLEGATAVSPVIPEGNMAKSAPPARGRAGGSQAELDLFSDPNQLELFERNPVREFQMFNQTLKSL